MGEMGTWLSSVWSATQPWIIPMTVFSVLTFVATLLALPRLFASLPQDYFTAATRPSASWIRNTIGAGLILIGLALLLLPGQGVLTILAGLMLADFPGKQELERRLLGRPRVLEAINGLRERRGQPPLHAPV